jgi:hypothetical protein
MCAFAAVFAALSASAAQANTRPLGALFVGTDQEEFDGAVNGPDRLGRFRTDGPSVVRGKILSTPYPINGMGNGRGFLYAGDPYSNTIRKISYNGSLLGTIVGGFTAGCCSEDMVRVGKFIYHAHWPSAIEKLNRRTGALVQTYAQSDVVGMAVVSGGAASSVVLKHAYTTGQIWITHWGAEQVGTWDPATNTFTPRFSTPNVAGGLAWDAGNSVLWVGLGGGSVIPYHLNGTPYNAGFQPFGAIPDTVDGLEFIGDFGS